MRTAILIIATLLFIGQLLFQANTPTGGSIIDTQKMETPSPSKEEVADDVFAEL